MTLYDLINKFKDTSLKHVLVNEFGDGDIYEYLNSGEHKYPCVFLTITGISDNDYDRSINCTLFYVDRLTSDSSNKKLVQSTGLTVLSEILSKFNTTGTSYTPFTEKFSDLCAGEFAETNISIELDFECGDNFKIRNKYIVENGTYDVENIDEVIVECPSVDEYIDEIERLEGEVQVKDKLINSVTSLEITENGTYIAPEGTLGYNNISVNVETEKWLAPEGTKFSNSDWNEIPDIDYSNLTPAYLFNNTYNLKYFYCPATLNLIPECIFSYMFNYSGVKEITGLITDNATDVSYMFSNCRYLTTINGELDFSNCKNSYNMTAVFGTSYAKLYELHTVRFKGSINTNIAFYSPVLSYESVRSILTACSNTINNDSKTLIFDSLALADNNGELSDLITTCNSKGWTISGLTLN